MRWEDEEYEHHLEQLLHDAEERAYWDALYEADMRAQYEADMQAQYEAEHCVAHDDCREHAELARACKATQRHGEGEGR